MNVNSKLCTFEVFVCVMNLKLVAIFNKIVWYMMERYHSVYRIGFDEEVMRDEGDVISYVIKSDDGKTIELKCTFIEKKMEIYLSTLEQQDENGFEIIMNDIIDLDKNGERWEGPSLNDFPYGFGKLFDGNNKLHYCGYMFYGKKICFGEEFYKDGQTVEYRGNFMDNMRHGRGILYDLKGSKVFEGNWHFGDNSSQFIINPKCNENRVFTDNVKELVIEDFCFKDLEILHFENNHILEKLMIRDDCFRNVSELRIAKCAELRRVIIGKESLKHARCVLHDCSKLELLDIGYLSFSNSDVFELKGAFLIVY